MSETVLIISHEKAAAIINSREPKGLYIVLEGGKYIGIDNNTGDAWVEEFETISDCKAWLLRKPKQSGGDISSG